MKRWLVLSSMLFIIGCASTPSYSEDTGRDVDFEMRQAIVWDKLETVKNIIAQGYDVKKHSYRLLDAAGKGNYEITKLLLENGANVNVRNDIDYTPLHNAMGKAEKYVKTSELLIQHGADVNARGGIRVSSGPGKWKHTPLHLAAREGNLEIVKLLIEHGAKIEAKDFNNATPLFMAVTHKRKEVVKYLLEKGANINVRGRLYSDHREYPIHRAIESRQDDMAELLVAYGADLNVKNQKGQTPLQLAIDLENERKNGRRNPWRSRYSYQEMIGFLKKAEEEKKKK